MSYIDLINHFWDVRETETLSGNDADLYFFILNKANRMGWPKLFTLSNRQIYSFLSISEKTLIGSRNRLKQAGLIEFKSGKNDKTKTEYELIYCKNSSRNDSSSSSRSSSSDDSSTGKKTPDNSKTKDLDLDKDTTTSGQTGPKDPEPSQQPFVPPSKSEVEAFFIELIGYAPVTLHQQFSSAFINYHIKSNWHDRAGNRITDWRLQVESWRFNENWAPKVEEARPKGVFSFNKPTV